MLLDKEKKFVSAVVYIYNQKSGLTSFLNRLNACLNNRFEKYEIICVDDASTDGSAAVIKEFASAHPEAMISLLHMSFYQGLEISMNAGVDLSIGDFVYEFDSLREDYPALLIEEVYFHSLKGFDIVSAAPDGQTHRRSSLFYSVFNRAAGMQYMLRTEAFRLLSRRAVNRVHSMSVVIPYRKAVYANCGLKTDVLFFTGDTREVSLDQKTRRNQRETAVDALVLYTDLAWRCSMLLSFIMMAVAAGSGVYTVFIYCSGRPVAGWTTTMLVLSGGFLGVFVMLTILIKYISIVLRLTFNRQNYIVESIEKLK